VILVPLVVAVSSVAKLVVVAPVLSVVAAVTVTIAISGVSAKIGFVFAGILVVIK
jgi:hypothetical protein